MHNLIFFILALYLKLEDPEKAQVLDILEKKLNKDWTMKQLKRMQTQEDGEKRNYRGRRGSKRSAVTHNQPSGIASQYWSRNSVTSTTEDTLSDVRYE